MLEYTKGKPCPDYGLIGVYRRFSKLLLEQTAFCAGNCIFCESKHRSSKGTMSLGDLEHILLSLPEQKGLVNLCGNGEPLLLDDLPERVALVKKYWPQALVGMISTLNVARSREYFSRLFDAGLRHIDLSCYGHSQEDYRMLHGVDSWDPMRQNIEIIAPFQSCYQLLLHLHLMGDTGIRYGFQKADLKKSKFISFAQRHNFSINGILSIEEWHNDPPHHGTGPVSQQPYPCPVVWGSLGGELHITWDLNVVPCMRQYESQFAFGNLHDNSLGEIFSSEPYRNFYESRWAEEQNQASPCHGCTYPMHMPSASELIRMAAYAGQKLAGQDVFFYIKDLEVYENYKFLFSHVSPKGALIGLAGGPEETAFTADGIQRIDFASIGRQAPFLPIIVFAKPHDNLGVLELIWSKNPAYTKKDITLAVAKVFDWFTHFQG